MILPQQVVHVPTGQSKSLEKYQNSELKNKCLIKASGYFFINSKNVRTAYAGSRIIISSLPNYMLSHTRELYSSMQNKNLK
jgi:hypothetical protein